MLPPDQSARLVVVLVSPRNPLNIGAAARAMANFGVERLAIVAPFAVNWAEAKSAVGAPELLLNARVYPTLAEAVASCSLVIGTGSLDKRRPTMPILSLPAGAELIRQALAQPPVRGRADQAASPTVALLFGSEKHGLTSDDLSFCHALVSIDTAPQQPSINLGQSVAICLWELTRDPDAQPVAAHRPQPPALPAMAAPLPDTRQIEILAGLIDETMRQVHYSTRGLPEANPMALRILLHRLMPDEADLRRIMGLFRRILHQLHKRDQPSITPSDHGKPGNF